jgi:flagellar biosynthetic protein FlhB
VAENRTEKATPKRREEARKKGQVAKSHDLNGAVILLAALLALSAFGPAMIERMEESMRIVLHLVATPDVVSREGIGEILKATFGGAARSAGPVIAVCALTGVVINVVQTGIRPTPGAIKPDPKKINPLTGAKNLFGMRMVFETGKNLAKVGVVGAIAALAVFPKLDELAALVGMPPAQMLPMLASDVLHVAQRAAVAYLFIAFVDYAWQRYRHEKSMKMDKQEVKDEFKGQMLPAEIRMAQRRRARELANARMMDDVPTADVVVTNPTHYSVALRYDSSKPAPVVVAKGTDNLAFKIREVAKEAGVSIVPDPPLARALHASVEIGQMIPEELFQAVAHLLAYVYRVARRAPLTAGAAA